jgi:hypothetical protein
MQNDRQPERSFYQRASEIAQQRGAEAASMPRRHIDWPALRPKLRRAALLIVVIATVLLAGAYAYDSVAIRILPQERRIGSVDVDWFISVQEKGGKFELIYDHTQPESCVNSLFPHFGMPPCWYARRNSQRRIEM